METIKGKRGGISSELYNSLKSNLGISIVLLILIVALSLGSKVFLTMDNLMTVLRQVFSNVCLSIGMTYVIILGGIDLCGGALIAMTGVGTVAMIMHAGLPIWLAILLAVLLGAFIGLINGTIITNLKVPAFIVTMAMMNIARGFAYVYTGGTAIRIQSVQAYTQIGVGRLMGIPYQIFYAVILLAVFGVILNKTKFGTYVYAIGGNREAARLSGIPIKKVEIACFTISGFMAALAGVVLSARMYSAQPSVGDGYEMDAIAACVLGGISMQGGVGRISGTIIGVLVIGVINNGLNLLGVNSFWQLVAKGAIILIAITIDTLKTRSRLQGKDKKEN